uniref:Tify domain-containing protein n=1 Tax=Picea sitchensis TaxID=3332 RepID=D5ABM4_PICSI|nr:unknown [Picea sitchensis]
MGLVVSTKLKLGTAFEEQCDEETGLPSWITSVNGGAKRAVADCISRLAPSMIPEKPSSAKLSIFYGGTVYIYDDIPTDKAQAIMLMASSGNYSSYPHTKVHNGWGSQTEQKLSVPVIKLSNGSGIHPQTSSPKLRTGSSDIPIARKHSLQRFLQNRRDRVNANAKGPYKTAEAERSSIVQSECKRKVSI